MRSLGFGKLKTAELINSRIICIHRFQKNRLGYRPLTLVHRKDHHDSFVQVTKSEVINQLINITPYFVLRFAALSYYDDVIGELHTRTQLEQGLNFYTESVQSGKFHEQIERFLPSKIYESFSRCNFALWLDSPAQISSSRLLRVSSQYWLDKQAHVILPDTDNTTISYLTEKTKLSQKSKMREYSSPAGNELGNSLNLIVNNVVSNPYRYKQNVDDNALLRSMRESDTFFDRMQRFNGNVSSSISSQNGRFKNYRKDYSDTALLNKSTDNSLSHIGNDSKPLVEPPRAVIHRSFNVFGGAYRSTRTVPIFAGLNLFGIANKSQEANEILNPHGIRLLPILRAKNHGTGSLAYGRSQANDSRNGKLASRTTVNYFDDIIKRSRFSITGEEKKITQRSWGVKRHAFDTIYPLNVRQSDTNRIDSWERESLNIHEAGLPKSAKNNTHSVKTTYVQSADVSYRKVLSSDKTIEHHPPDTQSKASAPVIDVTAISTKVMQQIEKRVRIERERRGLL